MTKLGWSELLAYVGAMAEKEKREEKITEKVADSRILLTPEAKRALTEAEARRRMNSSDAAKTKEINGPKGPEPTRYGDWESKGIASDF